MPSRPFFAVALVAALLLASSIDAAAQRAFSLDDIVPPRGEADPVTLIVATSGTPLPVAELQTETNWRIGMVTDAGTVSITPPKGGATWSPASKTMTFSFPRSATNNADLSGVGWVVFYLGSQLLNVSVDAESPGRFKAAKSKDDAWFYAFGSVLVGPSTKPIYVIDLKVDYAEEIGTSGWKWRAGGTANTNTNAEPPVDKVRIDPDALTAFAAFSKQSRVNGSAWLNGRLLTLSPVVGEFSRKDGVADVVTAGQLRLDLKPVGTLSFYPMAGYEFGHTVRKPSTISDQAVDLADWNWIVRGLLGITGRWTLFKEKPTDDDWYKVTVSANYTARFLGQPEPFPKPGVVDGARAVVTTVNKDVRHHAEAALDWNLMKYTSVSLKYQYGSVPPLFQLVDHQWTLGITLKAAQK